MNSTILPLVDSNIGGILQVELNRNNYMMVAVSRTGCDSGYNPFNSDYCDGYAVVGEYGHIFADGAATLRINPFYTSTDVDMDDGTGNAAAKMPGLSRASNILPAIL